MLTIETSAAHLRLINSNDLAAAIELSTAAGWNQTSADWSMLIDLAPEGCFGIELDGCLVSTTTLVCYGQRLAWIGMVLTRPEWRGRGFARKLLTHTLQYADSLGIETIKLDATSQGQPLYETVGFRPEQAIERWARSGGPGSPILGDPPPLRQSERSLDLEAFGADRSGVLHRLAQRSCVSVESNGYLFARSGRTTAYLGPCVASNKDEAHRLIRNTVSRASDIAWSWDLFPANPDAVALASELGFTRQRILTRMTRGKPLRTRDDTVYAIAGFELG